MTRPPFDEITIPWIREQQKKHGITDYELGMQIGQQPNYLSDVFNTPPKRNLSKIGKAAIWHFFKKLEK